MAHEPVTLPWGKETLRLNLPDRWELAGVLEPQPLAAAEDTGAETRRSLREPIGCPRLADLYRPGVKVALVIDDDSRPTPVARLLPAVLEELKQSGLRWADLTLVPAIGQHRAMAPEEIARRIGFPDLDGIHFENPEIDNPEKLAYLGTTRRGTPVWIHKAVAEAGLVISIGCIEPHLFASFGGGYKNLVPGVAGRETTTRNHLLNCVPDTYNMVGQPIDQNPMRLDLEEAGRMVKAPVFIVNAVLNSSAQVVRVVAGDGVAAHREGARTSAQIYGVPVPRQADVVITNSCPMDCDLRQGFKALANTIRATRKGGVLITLVRADEGVGVFGLANRKLPVGRRGLRLLAPLLVRIVPHLKLKGMGDEDRLFLYFALQGMLTGTLVVVAPSLPDEVKSNLVFVQFASCLDEAVRIAERRFPGSASVLVFPHGGTTYPILA